SCTSAIEAGIPYLGNHLVCERRGAVRRRYDCTAICAHRCNHGRHASYFCAELLIQGCIHLLGQMTKHDVASEVVWRLAGTVADIALPLPPTERGGQRVMAGHTIHLAELGPGAVLGAHGYASHALPQLDSLSRGPGAHPKQWVAEWILLIRSLLDPVWPLSCGVGIELEDKRSE